jgi:DNA-directed RNA polymerase subunit beta
MVNELIHYKIKLNDLQGALREVYNFCWDELPAGILKLAKVYIAKT